MPVAKPRKRKATSGLTFINVSHPDEILQRSTQAIIRSKALSSISRARRKKPVKPIVLELEMLQPPPAYSKDLLGERSYGTEVIRLCQTLGLQSIPPALPHLGIFAVEPDYRARELLYFMSSEAKHVYRPFRAEWFNMAILSSTSYYLCLANAALFLNQHATGSSTLEYTDSVESTRYYSKCLSQVNNELACSAEGISEGTITTILGFICHSLATGNYEKCEMHIHGLERIIGLRGGFCGLGDLLVVFASWFDITNAAFHDKKPRLCCPPTTSDDPSQPEPLPLSLAPLFWGSGGNGFEPSHLEVSMRKTRQLATYIDKYSTQPQFWEAGIKSTTMLGPVAHCILSVPRLDVFRPHSDTKANPTMLLRECVRLALLILMALMKRAFSLIADELNVLLDKLLDLTREMADISYFPGLRLWIYLVNACAREDPISQLHLGELCRTMTELQISNSEQAVRVAKNVVWIHCLMDERAESVKDQIDQYLADGQHIA
ncbi:hypothetical protein DL98DRAFT_104439 [Cadophora sp. DSE1049]|nr:hypothetical protein DL98DRAFT_104439 [Cadophora sp. DSE1049]